MATLKQLTGGDSSIMGRAKIHAAGLRPVFLEANILLVVGNLGFDAFK